MRALRNDHECSFQNGDAPDAALRLREVVRLNFVGQVELVAA